MPLKICINGSKGRMGQAIAQAAEEAGHEVTGKVDIGDDLAEALEGAQVVIDLKIICPLPLTRL